MKNIEVIWGFNDNAGLQLLSFMKEQIDKYGVISVVDYYDYLHRYSLSIEAYEALIQAKYVDMLYGWTDLKDVKVVNVRRGYMIVMPEPILLNNYD